MIKDNLSNTYVEIPRNKLNIMAHYVNQTEPLLVRSDCLAYILESDSPIAFMSENKKCRDLSLWYQNWHGLDKLLDQLDTDKYSSISEQQKIISVIKGFIKNDSDNQYFFLIKNAAKVILGNKVTTKREDLLLSYNEFDIGDFSNIYRPGIIWMGFNNLLLIDIDYKLFNSKEEYIEIFEFIKKRIKKLEKVINLKFVGFETDRGFHFYCVSHFFQLNSGLAIALEIYFRNDQYHIISTIMKNRCDVRLSPKYDLDGNLFENDLVCFKVKNDNLKAYQVIGNGEIKSELIRLLYIKFNLQKLFLKRFKDVKDFNYFLIDPENCFPSAKIPKSCGVDIYRKIEDYFPNIENQINQIIEQCYNVPLVNYNLDFLFNFLESE